jgi:hypothetical protein
MRRLLTLLVIVGLVGVVPAAGQIPPPAGPVTFCGSQATPVPDSYTVSVDGGAQQALTMDASVNAGCPAGTTHSFQLPASVFTVGTHTVQVFATNVFGTTAGPVYSVQVGIAPGQFTITAIVR